MFTSGSPHAKSRARSEPIRYVRSTTRPRLDDGTATRAGELAVLAQRLPRLLEQVRLATRLTPAEAQPTNSVQTVLRRDGLSNRKVVETGAAGCRALVAG